MSNTKLFTLKSSVDKQFFFTTHGLNGKVISTSEMYTRKHGAFRGIRAVLHATEHKQRWFPAKTVKDNLVQDLTSKS